VNAAEIMRRLARAAETGIQMLIGLSTRPTLSLTSRAKAVSEETTEATAHSKPLTTSKMI